MKGNSRKQDMGKTGILTLDFGMKRYAELGMASRKTGAGEILNQGKADQLSK
jgi:hypothetical protein